MSREREVSETGVTRDVRVQLEKRDGAAEFGVVAGKVLAVE